jgi:hypothetical protein
MRPPSLHRRKHMRPTRFALPRSLVGTDMAIRRIAFGHPTIARSPAGPSDRGDATVGVLQEAKTDCYKEVSRLPSDTFRMARTIRPWCWRKLTSNPWPPARTSPAVNVLATDRISAALVQLGEHDAIGPLAAGIDGHTLVGVGHDDAIDVQSPSAPQIRQCHNSSPTGRSSVANTRAVALETSPSTHDSFDVDVLTGDHRGERHRRSEGANHVGCYVA